MSVDEFCYFLGYSIQLIIFIVLVFFGIKKFFMIRVKKLDPRLSWSMKGKYKSYNPNSRRCSLCLHEKLEIDDPDKILLKNNQKSSPSGANEINITKNSCD